MTYREIKCSNCNTRLRGMNGTQEAAQDYLEIDGSVAYSKFLTKGDKYGFKELTPQGGAYLTFCDTHCFGSWVVSYIRRFEEQRRAIEVNGDKILPTKTIM